jgi:hypothetical protein
MNAHIQEAKTWHNNLFKSWKKPVIQDFYIW